jgi:hypothetical protein
MKEKWKKQDLPVHTILTSSAITPFRSLCSNIPYFLVFSPSLPHRSGYAKAQCPHAFNAPIFEGGFFIHQ